MEQNPRPYGKIEDGLPRWHVKQRRQEYDRINAKLDHPNVRFIPSTKLGRDIALEEILGWGLSAVCLAVGAWRDRPLPVPGIDAYIGRGHRGRRSKRYRRGWTTRVTTENGSKKRSRKDGLQIFPSPS